MPEVSKVIAVQISMSYNSVESYGMLAKFLDEIAEKDEVFFTALVENKIVISFEKLRKFAQMDETKLIGIRRKLLREEDVKMRRRKPHKKQTEERTQAEGKKPATPLEVGIKDMPQFDPDMEFRGLALTIPTWINKLLILWREGKKHSIRDNLSTHLGIELHFLCLTQVRDADLKEVLPEGTTALMIPNAEIKELFETTVVKRFKETALEWNRKNLFDAMIECMQRILRTIMTNCFAMEFPFSKNAVW